MKLEFCRRILEKYSNVKFHENMSSGSRVVPCGQPDMTKLTVAYRNFAKASATYKLNVIFASFCVIWHDITLVNLKIGLDRNIRRLLHFIYPSLCP